MSKRSTGEGTYEKQQTDKLAGYRPRTQNSAAPIQQQEQSGNSSLGITVASQVTQYLMKQVLRLRSTQSERN